MGRLLKDGTVLSPDEIRSAAVRGYYPHVCIASKTTTPKQSNQDSLF